MAGDYTSITAAFSAAASGDEISVGAGTWYESLSLGNKTITITGSAGMESVILDAAALAILQLPDAVIAECVP